MSVSRPLWFRSLAVLLILWGVIGVFACIQQIRLGAEAMPDPTDYDRVLYAALPVWYDWVYALAVGAGLAGALTLLTGRRAALPLFVVSLAAVLLQFGFLFATTDIIAVKGMWTIYFPLFITAVGVIAVWLASTGRRRGWLR